MVTDKEKKEKLVQFLEKKVFDPVLNASESKYNDKQRKKLEHVKKSTESEKDRFERYNSATDIKINYLNDLDSNTAKEINDELKELGLPRLPDLKKEFLHLCEELEV